MWLLQTNREGYPVVHGLYATEGAAKRAAHEEACAIWDGDTPIRWEDSGDDDWTPPGWLGFVEHADAGEDWHFSLAELTVQE
jgi:hypothetical protein